MTQGDERKVDYMVVVVGEFAEASGMSHKEAFERLLACGGIDALEENYEIERTLPIESTVDALTALCERMGRSCEAGQ